MAPQGEIPVAASVLGVGGSPTPYGMVIYVHFVQRIELIERLVDHRDSAMNFNIPIQVQPQVFMLLCLVNWGQILLYSHKWPLWRVLAVTTGTAAIFAGVEAALILTLRPIYKAGNETPLIVIGVVAAILLAAGLLPPYGEAWKRRGRIIGINFVFLTVDSLGALFSLLSLVAQHTFDILGGVMYIVCILLEIGIFASHLIWLFRTRQIRKEAKHDGKTFDDVMAEYEQQGVPFKFAERKTTWPWRKGHREDIATNNDDAFPVACFAPHEVKCNGGVRQDKDENESS
ncbi:hypothetical protein NUW58_g9607 [Xylaria curta]|uniref:Uncharacterized protein n=1 Tax=Xylaria curta TaxID=42375 RepID=A0ACC1MWW0_9PEZI|nr:hypothetical protein NUW58_g9607 [Xylaria curta]